LVVLSIEAELLEEGAEESAEYKAIAGETQKLVGAGYEQMKQLLEVRFPSLKYFLWFSFHVR